MGITRSSTQKTTVTTVRKYKSGRRRKLPKYRGLLEYIYKYSKQSRSGCWLWLGGIGPGGYGTASWGGKTQRAHRLSYAAFKGNIPDGLCLDHLCRVRSCINPQHLEAVTYAVNSSRGIGPSAINQRKTHCKNGHLFPPANSARRRICLPCQKVLARRWYVARRDSPEHVRQRAANRLVSNASNAIRSRQTHCKNGHEFSHDNTVRTSDGYRSCKICVKAYKVEYNRANRDRINLLRTERRRNGCPH